MTIRTLIDHPRFNAFIIAIIVLNAVLIGASTYTTEASALAWIAALEWLCVGIFLVEIVLRFLARDSTKAYFSDGWNIFDIIIVASAFVPAANGLTPILRILRVFRVLRLVKTIPELRLIVTVLVRSIVSMKYIGLLAAILFYVYAVIGVKLFGPGATPQEHPLRDEYATVHEACFTLFRVLTGDNWSDLRYAGIQGPQAWLVTAYHVSWIIVATFLLVNLIVGAIINNYQEVQQIERRKHEKIDATEQRLAELAAEIQSIVKERAARG